MLEYEQLEKKPFLSIVSNKDFMLKSGRIESGEIINIYRGPMSADYYFARPMLRFRDDEGSLKIDKILQERRWETTNGLIYRKGIDMESLLESIYFSKCYMQVYKANIERSDEILLTSSEFIRQIDDNSHDALLRLRRAIEEGLKTVDLPYVLDIVSEEWPNHNIITNSQYNVNP